MENALKPKPKRSLLRVSNEVLEIVAYIEDAYGGTVTVRFSHVPHSSSTAFLRAVNIQGHPIGYWELHWGGGSMRTQEDPACVRVEISEWAGRSVGLLPFDPVAVQMIASYWYEEGS